MRGLPAEITLLQMLSPVTFYHFPVCKHITYQSSFFSMVMFLADNILACKLIEFWCLCGIHMASPNIERDPCVHHLGACRRLRLVYIKHQSSEIIGHI